MILSSQIVFLIFNLDVVQIFVNYIYLFSASELVFHS